MYSVSPVPGKNPHFFLGDPAAMGANRPSSFCVLEVVKRVKILNGIHTVFGMTVSHFLPSLRSMYVQQ